MSQIVSIAPKASTALQAEPPDILRIETDLVRLAESSVGFEQQISSILQYLRRLTNARGILLLDRKGKSLSIREESWIPELLANREEFGAEIRSAVLALPDTQTAMVRSLAVRAKHFVIGAPFSQGGSSGGYVCLVLQADKSDELQPFVVILQTALGYLHYAFDRNKQQDDRWAFEQSTALLELSTRAAEADDFTDAARRLTTELQRHLQCYRVCLGVKRRDRVELTAISGVTQFDPRGTSAIVLEAALREAISKGTPIEWPRADGEIDLSEVAHQELQRLLDLERIITLPLLRADGKPPAAVTFLWNKTTPAPADAPRFLRAAEPHLASLVTVLRKSDPLAPIRWWNQTWGKLNQNRRKAVMWGAGGLFLLLAWPFPYHLRTDCRLQPVIKRVISAPFDGILKKTYVEPGEVVEKNKVLATMDDKELQWKYAELMASRDRALKQRDRSMTDEDSQFAVSQMAQFEAEGLDLEIKLTEFKKDNLEIKAPLDGIVLTGDLKRAEGMTVTKGQVLFEVAPVDKIVIELMIPDSEISRVRDSQEIYIKLDSFPGETWAARIRKINPQSEPRDGRNVFIAEAPLTDRGDETALRPGMKGRAVIIGDRYPLFWILTHKLWDYLRILLFW